jgi:hypothetical protein
LFVCFADCSPARITNPPDGKIAFVAGKPLTIKCDATGDPIPTISWNDGGRRPMTNTSRIHILPSGALHFTQMRSGDIGEYTCTASNNCNNPETAKTKLVLASKCVDIYTIF